LECVSGSIASCLGKTWPVYLRMNAMGLASLRSDKFSSTFLQGCLLAWDRSVITLERMAILGDVDGSLIRRLNFWIWHLINSNWIYRALIGSLTRLSGLHYEERRRRKCDMGDGLNRYNQVVKISQTAM
jgi:hypothetical protein